MPATGDRGLENLIRGSEDLIRDLETHGVPARSAALPESLTAHVEEQAAVPLESYVQPNADGTATVEISKDGMLAFGQFHPAAGNGAPVALDSVRALLGIRGVTYGVDWDAVKGCILTCNEERTEVADAVIARGRSPVDERPPVLVLVDRLVSREKNDGPETHRVNFKELQLFTLVKKGDILAEQEPRRGGEMGVNVQGIAVAFSREHVSYPRAGKNTEQQGGNVVAACDGRFQVNADSFWVDEVLDILGDIDLRVGNIDFPGDVVIRGEIRDGFTVKAGKSILCAGCIGAARVECKGDLVTQQGIVGKEKALILVGGTTEAKFVEGCALDSAGPVRVRTSVLNSTVHTGDRLEMGERGIIIGGIVKAQNGVSAAQIGTERGPRTEIHCGIDFKVEQKLVWIRDRNIALAFKMREIEAKIKVNPGVKQVLAPLHARIKAAIHKLNENARTLVAGLDRNDKAEVSVRGGIFPGTYIEICHVSHFVSRPKHLLTFRLDKMSGVIVETPWQKPHGGPAAGAPSATAPASAPTKRPAPRGASRP
jgi:uncharacterized protein (DUF342 family)